ncbi:dihydrofolate reductase [Colobine gammaherpesvirus 1]|uniref:dihydrofolate reductase n=1 Tax=Colobine gammaherpesvirus 1 TaxID=2597325 RepID=A0A5B8G8V7_9GAMA|nr:dihydrofolate reductase [Colobine gammaherpesvirus 1]QDQ69218.1 dihydrofolate reductase [Colobine gammaherpesvirus 1]
MLVSMSDEHDRLSEINCVVAVCEGMGICAGGLLPRQRLRGDMTRFYCLTTEAPPGLQNLIIMGRRTWESLPQACRSLAGRINMVLIRALKEPPSGAHFLECYLCFRLFDWRVLCACGRV